MDTDNNFDRGLVSRNRRVCTIHDGGNRDEPRWIDRVIRNCGSVGGIYGTSLFLTISQVMEKRVDPGSINIWIRLQIISCIKGLRRISAFSPAIVDEME